MTHPSDPTSPQNSAESSSLSDAGITPKDSLPPVVVDPALEDSMRPLRNSIRASLAAFAICLVALPLASYFFAGLPGVYGAAAGVGTSAVFLILSIAIVLATAKTTPTVTMVSVLGGWLLKMVILLLFLAWARKQDFFNFGAMGAALVVTLVVVLAVEIGAILRTRSYYVG